MYEKDNLRNLQQGQSVNKNFNTREGQEVSQSFNAAEEKAVNKEFNNVEQHEVTQDFSARKGQEVSQKVINGTRQAGITIIVNRVFYDKNKNISNLVGSSL